MFELGQLIVCVDTNWLESTEVILHEKLPIQGYVYTVRNMGFDYDNYGLMQFIRLEEIVNAPDYYTDTDGKAIFDEICFAASHFKPLKGNSIAVFRNMLNKVRVDA